MKDRETSEGSEGSSRVSANDVPFGSNEVRLNGRQWIAVIGVVGLVVASLPSLWLSWERVPFSDRFRVPYELSKDYWLYEKYLEHMDGLDSIFVVGDSVVWGEYVSAEGTLSAFLDELADENSTFVNAGVNGLFPLALEGLVQSYGKVMKAFPLSH